MGRLATIAAGEDIGSGMPWEEYDKARTAVVGRGG